ncbi:MAG: hypothetical protein D3913_04550 [Candidatus Electrothrix sp. LOE1_4_5]|nr:hypothetical protein [Candidatus Electrothrix gigas]
MKKKVIRSLVISVVLLGASNVLAITTDDTPTAEELVSAMLGSNITADNITLTCAGGASGTFADGETAVGIAEGIILSSGNISNVIGPNDNDGISASPGTAGDADLEALIGENTNDACVLEFDFQLDDTPGLISASVAFNYVFASDEYNEYVDSFNDVFAFFVDGENIALIPGTATAVSIDNVNQEDNYGFYINNDDCQSNPTSCPVPDTQMDGLTTVLSTAEIEVFPGQPYHLKLAIADALDTALDSNVFIEAGSLNIVSSQPPEAQCKDVTLNLGSNGQAVLIPSQVDNGSSDPEGDPITYSLSRTNFNCSDIGTQHVVTLTVTDNGGLSDSCIANVTVVDNLAPVPNTASLPQVTGQCSATIPAAPTATDNCAGTVTGTTGNPLSYSTQGTYTVNWTFDDGKGNTATQTQQVVVQDTIAPTVITKNITVQLDSEGNGSIPVDAVDNGSTDNCCLGSKSISKSSFTCADVGQNTVTLTVTDCNGNSSSAPATVTVEDTLAPINVQTNAPVTIIPPDAPISFTATAEDNCSVEVAITDYDCYKIKKNGSRMSKMESCVVELSGDTITIVDSGGVGDNIVWTMVATDQSGNTTTAEGHVLVGNPGKSGDNGNNGVGNGEDPQPPGNPPINDGTGAGPGKPGNKGKKK